MNTIDNELRVVNTIVMYKETYNINKYILKCILNFKTREQTFILLIQLLTVPGFTPGRPL